MPGFRDFSVELRRRDSDYEDVTVNHVGLYAIEVSESFFGTDFNNRVVERDSIDQELSDIQVQNIILSENPDQGLIVLMPTDSDGNSKINIGHFSNTGGKSILNFSFGNIINEEYNFRVVNNSDHELVIESSTDSISSDINIDSNVRIRTGHLRIEGEEISGSNDGVNLEFNWGDGDGAKWLIDLNSNISGGNDQLRFSTLTDTYASLKENGNVLIGAGTHNISSNGYDLQVYDTLYTNGNTHINGELYVNLDTELNGNLQVDLDTHLQGNLLVDLESVLTGNITAGSDLYVNLDTELNGNLQVDLDTELNGNLQVDLNTHLQGNLLVDLESNFTGDISGSDIYLSSRIKTNLSFCGNNQEMSSSTTTFTISGDCIVFVGTVDLSGYMTGIRYYDTAPIDGEVLYITNTTPYDLLLHNQSISSQSIARFQCPNDTDFIIGSYGGATLRYANSRWRIVGRAN